MQTDYPFLADLLKYPTGQLRARLADCQNETLSPFIDYVRSVSDTEWEELYIRTFDIQAICYLEIGYVLFGEDYKRGHFLVKMQGLQRAHNNDCGTELSDHLTNILTLLPKMQDREEAHDMVERLILPAMQKMLQGFSKGGNVYQAVLQAIVAVLTKDYDCSNPVQEKPGHDFSHYDASLELPSYNPSTNPWDIWREP